jgi:hypothetical protein
MIYASSEDLEQKNAFGVDPRRAVLYKSLPSAAHTVATEDSVSENWIAEESAEFGCSHDASRA